MTSIALFWNSYGRTHPYDDGPLNLHECDPYTGLDGLIDAVEYFLEADSLDRIALFTQGNPDASEMDDTIKLDIPAYIFNPRKLSLFEAIRYIFSELKIPISKLKLPERWLIAQNLEDVEDGQPIVEVNLGKGFWLSAFRSMREVGLQLSLRSIEELVSSQQSNLGSTVLEGATFPLMRNFPGTDLV